MLSQLGSCAVRNTCDNWTLSQHDSAQAGGNSVKVIEETVDGGSCDTNSICSADHLMKCYCFAIVCIITGEVAGSPLHVDVHFIHVSQCVSDTRSLSIFELQADVSQVSSQVIGLSISCVRPGLDPSHHAACCGDDGPLPHEISPLLREGCCAAVSTT